MYNYQTKDPGGLKYPPHCAKIPKGSEDDKSLFQIFDTEALLRTAAIMKGLWNHFTTPDPIYDIETFQDIIDKSREFRKEGTEVFAKANIGDRDDWFSDEVFAQQMFTGVNPTSIRGVWTCQKDWLAEFKKAIPDDNEDAKKLFESADAKSWFVGDYSYFRSSVGLKETDELSSSFDGDKVIRYGAASVVLFQLNLEGEHKGVLHPVAICLDYKGDMDPKVSVTMFNKSLTVGGNTLEDQEKDWPWRYAKTVLCMADWLHHEVRVHLTDTHFIEESIIVAAHQAFADDIPIYNLLEPHWDSTLALNEGARTNLVPNVIVDIAPLPKTGPANVYTYINWAFANFDFVGLYIPNDLAARGFDIDKLGDKDGIYKNYTYARNMIQMWTSLKTFVTEYIGCFPQYATDEQVAKDKDIIKWYTTLRSTVVGQGGGITTFPIIDTRDKLIDALTMCIHIASPQHTAINYLQQYYMSLVINKPPCLYTPLPQSLSELEEMTEKKFLKALPIGYGEHSWSSQYRQQTQTYMLASHLPWLLSWTVAGEQNIVACAQSLWHGSNTEVRKVAKAWLDDLDSLTTKFQENAADLTDKDLKYDVMDPHGTAVSILI